MLFWLTLIPLFGILAPIYLSFDQTIEPVNKLFIFLLLPAIEIVFFVKFLVESFSNKADVMNALQLPLIALLIIIGLCLTLILALVEGMDSRVRLTIRSIALPILSFIIVWGITSGLQ